jgi:3-isopropylmalate dehydrogenase
MSGKGLHKIAVIGGDGVGPEVTREASRVLEFYAAERGLPLELWQLDLGAERFLKDGTTLPPELRERVAAECSAILLGALGDARVPGFEHAREILFGLRIGLDLYANVRPLKALADRLVPLAGRTSRDVDIVIFRENTEGLYAGVGRHVARGTSEEVAINEDVNTRKGVERILRAAFEHACGRPRRRLHMADKSNALRYAHELWFRVFEELRPEYPSVAAEHVYIDTLCLKLIEDPAAFDVIVSCNLFGDILADLGAALQGGIGLAPSANIHPGRKLGLFEPVHGSAPDIAGKNLANPFGAIRSAGMLLGHLGWPKEQAQIEQAIKVALTRRLCTRDVGGELGTRDAGQLIIDILSAELPSSNRNPFP